MLQTPLETIPEPTVMHIMVFSGTPIRADFVNYPDGIVSSYPNNVEVDAVLMVDGRWHYAINGRAYSVPDCDTVILWPTSEDMD